MIKILTSTLIAYVIAEGIKVFLKNLKTKKMSIKCLFKPGGMPSAHSAAVSAMTLAVYLYQGFTSLFIVTSIFSFLVIRDTLLRTAEYRHKIQEVIVGVIIDIKRQVRVCGQMQKSDVRDWLLCYTSIGEIEANIKKAFLESKGIPAIVKPYQFTWGLPIRTAIDKFEVYVRALDADLARDYLLNV